MGLIYLSELRGKVEIRKGLVGLFPITAQGIGTITYCLYAFHPEVFLLNSDRFREPIILGLACLTFPWSCLKLRRWLRSSTSL
jgi:hypothetical protein